MSPWNRDALVSLREQLKASVWMDPKLIDKLKKTAGGYMDHAEVQRVKSLSGNRERVGLAIDALTGDEEFHAFCKLLQMYRYDHLACLLEDTAARFKKDLLLKENLVYRRGEEAYKYRKSGRL